MLGLPEEGKRLRRLHDLPGVHHIDQVTQLGYHAQVVGDKENGRAMLPAQVAHEGEDLGLDRHIQGRGRLVGQKKLRLAGHGHGDHHPLPQAAGELTGVGVVPGRRVGDAHLPEEVDGLRLGALPVHPPVQAQNLRHLPAHGIDGVEGGHGVLKDHGQPVPPELAAFFFRQLA